MLYKSEFKNHVGREKIFNNLIYQKDNRMKETLVYICMYMYVFFNAKGVAIVVQQEGKRFQGF